MTDLIEPVETIEPVRRGPGRPRKIVLEEDVALMKIALNKYHNEYYHAHKTPAVCACGSVLRGNRMGAHMKTARHEKAIQFLQSRGAYLPPTENL